MANHGAIGMETQWSSRSGLVPSIVMVKPRVACGAGLLIDHGSGDSRRLVCQDIVSAEGVEC